MIVTRGTQQYSDAKIVVDSINIERVSSFKYLGCWLHVSWNADMEIKTRIEQAGTAFIKFNKVLTNRDISLKLRLRFVKCYVWSILLYGAEIWTLKTKHLNRLEAFEMWCYRRMLKISWVNHISNSEVLDRIQTNRELLATIKRRKTAYFGHIMRGNKYELLQLIVQGKIEGRRGVGRKQLSWLRNIRNWTGIRTAGDLIHIAADREQFSTIINNVS